MGIFDSLSGITKTLSGHDSSQDSHVVQDPPIMQGTGAQDTTPILTDPTQNNDTLSSTGSTLTDQPIQPQPLTISDGASVTTPQPSLSETSSQTPPTNDGGDPLQQISSEPTLSSEAVNTATEKAQSEVISDVSTSLPTEPTSQNLPQLNATEVKTPNENSAATSTESSMQTQIIHDLSDPSPTTIPTPVSTDQAVVSHEDSSVSSTITDYHPPMSTTPNDLTTTMRTSPEPIQEDKPLELSQPSISNTLPTGDSLSSLSKQEETPTIQMPQSTSVTGYSQTGSNTESSQESDVQQSDPLSVQPSQISNELDMVDTISEHLPPTVSLKTAIAITVAILNDYSDQFKKAQDEGKVSEFFDNLFIFRKDLKKMVENQESVLPVSHESSQEELTSSYIPPVTEG